MTTNPLPIVRRVAPVAIALLAGVLLSACATTAPPGSTKSKQDSPALDVAYPEHLEGFTFRSMPMASPNPSWGTQLNYASGVFPELRLDVFAYHVGFTTDEELVVSQYEAFFPVEIGEAVAAGSYLGFTVQEQGRMPVTVNGRTREGAWFHFQLQLTELNRTSITHFHYRPPFAVKIRASHPDTLDAHNFREHIADFARQLVPELEITRTQGCDNVEIRVDPDAGEDSFATALEEALLDSGRRGCQDYDAISFAVEMMRSERDQAPGAEQGGKP